jgi:hypothetical protein
MSDGLKLARWFSGKEDEFMSLATQPSLPECFVFGDIPMNQVPPAEPKPLWRRILGN